MRKRDSGAVYVFRISRSLLTESRAAAQRFGSKLIANVMALATGAQNVHYAAMHNNPSESPASAESASDVRLKLMEG